MAKVMQDSCFFVQLPVDILNEIIVAPLDNNYSALNLLQSLSTYDSTDTNSHRQ